MACYLVNRSSSTTLVDKTPYEAWAGKNPSLAHLGVFGCDSFVLAPKEKSRKLDSKLEKYIFIGCKDGVKGYKQWNSVIRKIVHSIDVEFKQFGGTSKSEDVKR